jgi:hypothetical protein
MRICIGGSINAWNETEDEGLLIVLSLAHCRRGGVDGWGGGGGGWGGGGGRWGGGGVDGGGVTAH